MGKKKKLQFSYEEETKESPLTSFGGLPVFLEYLDAISFEEIINRHLPAIGTQGYAPVQYILSLVLLNLLGGESVADIELLEKDSGLKRLITQLEKCSDICEKRDFRKQRTRTFPSPSRIFGFLERFVSPDEAREREETPKGKSKILPVSELFSALVAINRDILHTAQKLSPQKVATLDMDNNLIVSHKSNAKVDYKKNSSYGPLNVYWNEMDLMLHSEFRDGNVPAGTEQLRVLKETLALLPSSVKQVFHRSDSAGYQQNVLEFMESGKSRFGKIEFAVSADVNKKIRSLVLDIPEEEWKPVVYKDRNGYEIVSGQEVAEICYVPSTKYMSKSAPIYRYIVTREAVNIAYKFNDNGQLSFDTSAESEGKLHLEVMNEKAHKVFAIVTNRQESPLEILLWSRKRCGRSEEEHSRLTTDMAGGRFPSDSFGENAAWWMIAIISLNLLKTFQKEALPKDLKRVRVKKLNHLYLRIAAKVVKFGHGLKIKIPARSTLYKLVKFAKQKITRIKVHLSDQARNKWQVYGIP